MEETCNTQLDKEYMFTMIGGIIGRIRLSYQQGLMSETSHERAMREACILRDEYDTISASEIQDRLKSLTAECGAWRLYDILMLHLGYDYNSQFNDLGKDEIYAYDVNFYPLFYTVKPKKSIMDSIENSNNNDDDDDIVKKENQVGLEFDGIADNGSSLKGGVIIDDINPDQFMILTNKSPIYQVSGGCLFLNSKSQTFLIFGTYVNETITYHCNNNTAMWEKRKAVFKETNKVIDKVFVKRYLEHMSLRDFDTKSVEGIIHQIKESRSILRQLVSGTEKDVLDRFQTGDASKRRELITLMFLQDVHLDVVGKFRSMCTEQEFNAIFTSLHLDIQKRMQEYLHTQTISDIFDQLIQSTVENLFDPECEIPQLISDPITSKKKRKISKLNQTKSLRQRVEECKAPEEAKEKALQRVRMIEGSRDGDAKAEKFVEGFLKIPFGVYKEDAIKKKRDRLVKRGLTLCKQLKLNHTAKQLKESKLIEIAHKAIAKNKNSRSAQRLLTAVNDLKSEKRKLLGNVRPLMDKAIFGHDEAKKQFEQIVAQWMNGDNQGAVIGIQGPPGNGKTSMVKEGLSKCLIDSDGKERPFVFIPLGGLHDGSALVGHSFTYVGSIWGKIADGLMKARTMNPIFYFDELDKISHTERGMEIVGALTHLTDSTQNQEFFDEYFSGIPLDLSKALFCFTFNDESRIDPILRDRIKIIRTKALKIPEKLVISQDYLLPKIREEIGLDVNDFQISDGVITKAIENYTAEAGVRKLKELLYDLVRESNRRGIAGDWSYPYKVDDTVLLDMLKRRHPIIHDKIHNKPMVGVMNGLYASCSGLGGITKIESTKCFSESHLKLKLTGNQGDVMKESMHCAMSVAWSKLTADERKKVSDDKFGIHIHCPSGATPKDGPSAGGAITLTILSLLRELKIPNDIAMTGEIDLRGNITEIGGLDAKLLGAQKAGVRKVFIPKDNLSDWKQTVEDKIVVPKDDFEVVTVEHIDEVIEAIYGDQMNPRRSGRKKKSKIV